MTREQVDAWNAAHPVGSTVVLAADDGVGHPVTVAAPAAWSDLGAFVTFVEFSGEFNLTLVSR